jgi:plastocyanin
MFRLAAIGAAVVVGGGACSDPYGSGGGGCTPTATRVCTVGLTAFAPETLTVPAGTTVMWLNGGGVAHTVTSDPGSSEVFDLSLGVGSGAVSHLFSAPDTVDYHCKIHPAMTGTIVVN